MAPSYLALMSLKHANVVTVQQLFSDSKQSLRLKLHTVTFAAAIPTHCLCFAPMHIFAEDREYTETEHRQGKLLTHDPALSTPACYLPKQKLSTRSSLPNLPIPLNKYLQNFLSLSKHARKVDSVQGRSLIAKTGWINVDKYSVRFLSFHPPLDLQWVRKVLRLQSFEL